MANFVLGKDCKAYASATPVTSTTYATPLASATEVTNIKDLKVDFTKETAEITTRGSGGWKNEVGTLIAAKITFLMLWKPADTMFTAIQTAFLGDTELAFFALDGDKGTTGKQGPAGNFTVTNFTRNESLTEAVTVDVELIPSSFNGWVTTT